MFATGRAPVDRNVSRFTHEEGHALAIADMIPALTDAELVNLNNNARRLAETGAPAQMAAAAQLLPQIEAEMAERIARRPAKPKVVRRKKVVVDAEAAAT